MKILLMAILSLMLLLCPVANTIAADELLNGVNNEIYFRNFENLFDDNGQYKPPGAPLEVGDHLVGIINIPNIKANGDNTYFNHTK